MEKIKIATNGCFDLFHAGHKRLLDKCLTFVSGGKLYILLNSDSSVSRLKGPDRPVNKLAKRIEDINNYINLWCSSRFEYPQTTIIVFDSERELQEIYEKIKADYIVKGNDYLNKKDIIGSNVSGVLILPKADKEEELVTTTDLTKLWILNN